MPSTEQLSFSTISCVTMPGTGPAVVPHAFGDLAAAVADAGFGRIGLDWFTIRDAERRGIPLDLGGLVPSELCALGLGPDPATDERVARSMARRCGELGIPVCVLASTVPPADALYERVTAVAAVFAEVGTRVAIEFVPYTGVRTAADALLLHDRTGCGVVLDTLHLLRSGGTVADLDRLGADGLACVQLADGPRDAPASLPDESRSARLLPGDGAVDFAGLAGWLDGRGYPGPLTVEVLSGTLRTLPAPDLTRRAYAAAAAALG